MEDTPAGRPGYDFTTQWFDLVRPVWDRLLNRLKPTRILEIGSFEGASACHVIDRVAALGPMEIHCIDTWRGGIEHGAGRASPQDMNEVEARFHRNIAHAIGKAGHKVDLHIHKGSSLEHCPRLLAAGRAEYFDLVYVDGSHEAPDVLADAVFAFALTRVGGCIIFDDYFWSERPRAQFDALASPKAAIDAFTTLYARKVRLLNLPIRQIYAEKLAR